MLLSHYVKAKCVNPDCPKPADTSIPVEEVADRVLSYPSGRDLRCKTCGHAIWTEPADA